jgi:hypothetical protein
MTQKEKDAASLSWCDFEKKYMPQRFPEWFGPQARRFNLWFCEHEHLESRPLKWVERNTGALGSHANLCGPFQDLSQAPPILVSVAPDVVDCWDRCSCSWGIVLHELAHYRAKNHAKQFKYELLVVINRWREFLRLGARKISQLPIAA